MKPEHQRARLKTIDGLRGIAALAVVFYHLHANLQAEMAQWLYGVPSYVFSRGYLGVPIFFVLSGFVITLSIGSHEISTPFAMRFALRRSIRLDPPYWASILLAIGSVAVSSRFFPDLHKTFPSGSQILAHLFYLQDLLGYGDIVVVYWTLCYEIQFYLFLILVLYSGQRLLQLRDTRQVLLSRLFLPCVIALACLSLLQFFRPAAIVSSGFFVRYWFCFSLGMFCCWSNSRWITPRWFLLHCLVVLLAGLIGNTNETAIAATLVGGFLFAAGKRNQNKAWLRGFVFQRLGTISYSLYLTHSIVGWSAVSLAKRLLGPTLSTFDVLLAFGTGLLASIVSAVFLYIAVERPSIQLTQIVAIRQEPRGVVERIASVQPLEHVARLLHDGATPVVEVRD